MVKPFNGGEFESAGIYSLAFGAPLFVVIRERHVRGSGTALARVLAKRMGTHLQPCGGLARVGHVFFGRVGCVMAGLATVLGHPLQPAFAGVGGMARDAAKMERHIFILSELGILTIARLPLCLHFIRTPSRSTRVLLIPRWKVS
jgi:hypothetical protein